MSEIVGTEGSVREAYAFACMKCGYGWEQEYEIAHHTDAVGHEHVTYHADGARVPSPLTRPTCLNCEGHVVRIMRAGQVSGTERSQWPGKEAETERAVERTHHWSPLHLLHRRSPTPPAPPAQ